MRFIKWIVFSFFVMSFFVSSTATALTLTEAENTIKEIMKVQEAGDLVAASLMKEKLIKELPPEFFEHKRLASVEYLFEYIFDDYMSFVSSIELGLFSDPFSSEETREYAGASLGKKRNLAHIKSFVDYGKVLKESLDRLQPIIEKVFGNQEKSWKDYALIGADVLFTGGIIHGVILLLDRSNNHEEMRNVLGRLPFYSSYAGMKVDKNWENVLIAYKRLYAKAIEYNKLRDLLVDKVKSLPNWDLNFIRSFDSNSMTVEARLLHFDKRARNYVFDLPITGFIYKANIEIELATGLMNDDEEKIMESGVAFSKITPFIGYCVSDNTAKAVIEVLKRYKSELSSKEYEQMKSQSMMMVDFLKMPNKVEYSWP